MINFLLVALGGAVGACSRYALTLCFQGWNWPVATAICNLVGSFVIGLISGLLLFKLDPDGIIRPLVITGLLGGFTTFSSFSLDALKLLQSADFIGFTSYILLSVVLGLVFVAIGYKIGASF